MFTCQNAEILFPQILDPFFFGPGCAPHLRWPPDFGRRGAPTGQKTDRHRSTSKNNPKNDLEMAWSHPNKYSTFLWFVVNYWELKWQNHVLTWSYIMLHLLALQIKEFETTPLKTTAAMNLSIKKKVPACKNPREPKQKSKDWRKVSPISPRPSCKLVKLYTCDTCDTVIP